MTLTPEQQAEIDKALEKEVNEIDDFGEEITPPEEAPSGDDPSGETPPAETPPTEEPPIETPPEGEEPNENPPEETPPVEEPVPPVEDKDSIIAELRKTIDEQNRSILDLKSNKPKPAEVPPKDETKPKETPSDAKPTEEPPKEAEYVEADFIGDLDMDDVSADKAVLNKVINNAVKSAISFISTNLPGQVINKSVEQTLLAMPQVVESLITKQSYLDNAVKTFYEENEDLVEVKATVGQIAESIAAEHPEYGIEQLFKEAGEKTRIILKMPAASAKPNNKEFENPAFVANNSQRNTPAEISDLQKELDEL